MYETMKKKTSVPEGILEKLKRTYPDKAVYDLDGRGKHFLAEIEPTSEHPEYDRAIEVIIRSVPHKHKKMTQQYTILRGVLHLYVDGEKIELKEGDTYTIYPDQTHWAESDEAWVEIFSEPGWTQEDYILVEIIGS